MSLEKSKHKSLQNFTDNVPIFMKKFEDFKNQTTRDKNDSFRKSLNLKQIANRRQDVLFN